MNDRIDPPGAESEGPVPEDAGLSVDERFARLVAEIGDGGAARQTPAPKEEAARTRELRSKWRSDPPRAVGWRTDGPSTLPGYLSPETPGKPPRKRRAASKWLPVVFVVLLVAGVGTFLKHAGSTESSPVNASPAGTEQPWTEGLSPSPSPSPSVSYANPDDAYFAGSPAIDWKDNEAGFSVPKAVEVHGVDSDDVATGYKLLERVVEAGNLDATVLDGGSTADFTRLLDPASQVYKELGDWIAHPGDESDPTDVVSRFDPATTRLLGHTVKVSGSMSASAGPQRGSAYLTANYIFVYAVGPAHGDTSDELRVTVHRTLQIEIFDSSEYQTDPGKAWITEWDMTDSNIVCYKFDGYIDPGFQLGGPGPNETGTADPYDTGNLLTQSAAPGPTSTVGECEAASGE
jgi:hypothetical protein